MLRFDEVRCRQGSFTLTAEFDVPRGARVALMGASGSGKSTLLNLVAGFLWPDEGSVVLEGQDMSRVAVADRPLSILFQDANLFPHLSVWDNVALGIAPSLKLRREDQDRVTQTLEQVGLGDMAMRKPADLSGGQQSRAALARMLLRDRPLALLDEPFAALDPALRRDMLDLVRDLCDAQDLSLVMATHDLRDAHRLCDRILLLEEGRVALDADLDAAVANEVEPLKPWM